MKVVFILLSVLLSFETQAFGFKMYQLGDSITKFDKDELGQCGLPSRPSSFNHNGRKLFSTENRKELKSLPSVVCTPLLFSKNTIADKPINSIGLRFRNGSLQGIEIIVSEIFSDELTKIFQRLYPTFSYRKGDRLTTSDFGFVDYFDKDKWFIQIYGTSSYQFRPTRRTIERRTSEVTIQYYVGESLEERRKRMRKKAEQKEQLKQYKLEKALEDF